MSWLDPLFRKLGEDLGAAPMRLLQAVAELGEAASGDEMLVVADKGAVIARLTEQERQPPSADTLRKRVEQVNAAAIALGRREYDGRAPFILSSRKTHYELRIDPAFR